MSEAANVSVEVQEVQEEKDGAGVKVDSVNKKKTAKKSGGEKVVKKAKKVVVGSDDDINTILEWVHEGTEVLFDKDDLPVLTEQELSELPYKAVKQYKSERAEKEKAAITGISEIETLSGNASTKLRLRKRRGWHQTWKRPDEFESAKEKGYVEIREKKGEEEKPGYERGPVIKIHKAPGEVELIAMEVSQERYDRHVQAVSQRSQAAYKNNKAGFQQSVEELNRTVDKENRVKIIDDEGDIG